MGGGPPGPPASSNPEEPIKKVMKIREQKNSLLRNTVVPIADNVAQDDVDSTNIDPPALVVDGEESALNEKLTYSQEYYILNRDKLVANRRDKEQEAKFGDYSGRIVKRPQKNFLWGYGT